MSKDLNLKSSTIEKGIDLAKGFLDKLITPSVESMGLLIGDNIKFLRFKNQVRILLKAKEYVEQRNISLKEIPIKILVPLLENASLEENEVLQDKWAKMIMNMADSSENFQNQIFPYILGQISIAEFEGLKKLLDDEIEYDKNKPLEDEIKHKSWVLLTEEQRKRRKLVNDAEQTGIWVNLQEFEISNLVRLGLIRQLPPRIVIEEFQTGGNMYDGKEHWHQIEAEYDPDDYGYRITELGEKFLSVCELSGSESSQRKNK